MVWPNRGWEEPQGKLWTSTEPWTPPVTTEQYTFTPEPPLVTIDEACKLLGIELPAYEEPPFDYPQPPPSPRAGEDLRRQQTDREAHERVYAPEYHRIVSSWGAASSGGSYRSRFEYLLNHGA